MKRLNTAVEVPVQADWKASKSLRQRPFHERDPIIPKLLVNEEARSLFYLPRHWRPKPETTMTVTINPRKCPRITTCRCVLLNDSFHINNTKSWRNTKPFPEARRVFLTISVMEGPQSLRINWSGGVTVEIRRFWQLLVRTRGMTFSLGDGNGAGVLL